MAASASAAAPRGVLGLTALVCVGLQFQGSLLFSSVALVVWLLMLALFSRPTLARLWLPRFWLVTFVVALGSGLLLGDRDVEILGVRLSRSGLEAGALMIIRGVFIFGLAAWASGALRAEHFHRVARRVGVPWLGAAIPVALKLLPELELWYREASAGARLRKGRRRRLARIYEVAVLLFCRCARLAERMVNSGPGERTFTACVVGPRSGGKTTVLTDVVEQLKEQGIVVGGVTQPAVHEAGRRVGYRIRDVETGTEHPFARRREGTRGFEFDPDGWQWARQRIVEARRSADVTVVDELGWMEALGKGHLPALLAELPSSRTCLFLVTIRSDPAHHVGVADVVGALEARLGPFGLTVEVGEKQSASEMESFSRRIIEQIRGAEKGGTS